MTDNRGMDRTIRIVIKQSDQDRDISHEEYTHLANTLWMMLRNTSFECEVIPDGKTPSAQMNAAWDEYGSEARWVG